MGLVLRFRIERYAGYLSRTAAASNIVDVDVAVGSIRNPDFLLIRPDVDPVARRAMRPVSGGIGNVRQPGNGSLCFDAVKDMMAPLMALSPRRYFESEQTVHV